MNIWKFNFIQKSNHSKIPKLIVNKNMINIYLALLKTNYNFKYKKAKLKYFKKKFILSLILIKIYFSMISK